MLNKSRFCEQQSLTIYFRNQSAKENYSTYLIQYYPILIKKTLFVAEKKVLQLWDGSIHGSSGSDSWSKII